MWIKSYPTAHDQIKNTKYHEEVLFLVDYLNQHKPFILTMYGMLNWFFFKILNAVLTFVRVFGVNFWSCQMGVIKPLFPIVSFVLINLIDCNFLTIFHLRHQFMEIYFSILSAVVIPCKVNPILGHRPDNKTIF